MLSIAVVVLGTLAAWTATVAFRQDKEIDSFAEAKPAVYAIPAPTAEALKRADAIELSFQKAISENTSTRIEMTAGDFNTLIATREILEGFNNTTRIESISDKGLTVSMSQQIRRGFLGGSRFLNGTLLLRPDLRTHTVFFVVEDIQLPGKSVPEGFIKQYSSLQIYRIDPNHPVLGEGLRHLESVTIEGDRLIIQTKPAEPRPK